jgi:hypothetical protein
VARILRGEKPRGEGKYSDDPKPSRQPYIPLRPMHPETLKRYHQMMFEKNIKMDKFDFEFWGEWCQWKRDEEKEKKRAALAAETEEERLARYYKEYATTFRGPSKDSNVLYLTE